MMNEYLLLKFLHIVGFAYWLGGDLGVFHSSFYVANPANSAEVRVAAARILFWLDQAPRICMTLMLPLGLHLTWKLGILSFSGWVMLLVWVAALTWLAWVVFLHIAGPSRGKTLLTTFDFCFRLLLSLGLLGWGLSALVSDFAALPYWVAIKIAIFGGLVGCGLIVRVRLREFGPAFANIVRGQVSDADNDAIRRSLGQVRPWVVTIWIGLLASAALGLHLI